MKKRYLLFIVYFVLLQVCVQGQTPYTPLFTSSNFTKTVDLSKPVGAIAGNHGTTPSGGVTYSIPIAIPPGTNGMIPSIVLQYNSQGENGIAGYGWSIGGLSAITRSGKNVWYNGIGQPVTYTRQDNFYLDGIKINQVTSTTNGVSTDLAVAYRETALGAYYASNSITFNDGFSSEDGASFSAEVVNAGAATGDGFFAAENENFSRIIYSGNPDNPTSFRVIKKDGSIMEYGNTSDSKLLTDDGVNVMVWRLNRIIDINGNYIDFVYTGAPNTDRDFKIKTIKYSGNINTGQAPFNTINFNYTVRSDRNVIYEAGASLISFNILSQIQVTNESGAVFKTYDLNYGYDNNYSFLKEVVEKGTDNTALNSTIFLYGDKPQNLTVMSAPILAGQVDYFAGDFDGDGRSDLLAAGVTYNNTPIKRHTNFQLRTRLAQNSYVQLYQKDLDDALESIESNKLKRYNFLTSDYDGDGRDDVLTVSSTWQNPNRILNNVTINYTRNFSSQTGTAYTYTNYTYPTALGIPFRHINTTTGHFFVPGDFNGDGNQDYILIVSAGGSAQYKAFLTSPSTNEINQEIVGFGFGSNPSPEYYATTVANANMITPIDFDGDGRNEIMVTKDGASYIIAVKPIPPSTGYLYAGEVISQAVISGNSKIFPGDFNGDKKSDLLFKDMNSGLWYIATSNGKSYTGTQFTFNQNVKLTGDYSDDKIVVADFDGDGKTDILHGYTYGGSASKLSLYYSKGFWGTPTFSYEQYDYNDLLPFIDLVVGDFNGDGRSDVMSRTSITSEADFISFKASGKERLLMKVTNGHNFTTAFDYRPLTDNLVAEFYERTVNLDNAPNAYPFNYVELPVNVVSYVTSPNGVGGNATTAYYYKDAVLHRSGKGFIGFKSIKGNNLSTGYTSLVENEINTTYAIGYPTRVATLHTGDEYLITESKFTTSFKNLSTGYADKRFLLKIDKSQTFDYGTGHGSEILSTYDQFGNITTEVVKKGMGSAGTVTPVETTTRSITFGTFNSPVPARATEISNIQIRSGAAQVGITRRLTYTAAGNPATQVDFPGQSKALTTTVTYNALGNVTQSVLSSPGLSNRTEKYTWDAKGRFITKKEWTGTGIARSETLTYDVNWGKPLTHLSIDGLTTKYEYDVFGREKKVTVPQGYAINFSQNWDISGGNVYYTFRDYPGGKPDEKIWYDVLGRATKAQTLGFGDQWLTQTTGYNARGQVVSQSMPYYASETPLVTSREYDDYGRIVRASNALSSTDFTYSLQQGKLQVTTKNGAGFTKTVAYDATGKVVSASDPGGLVENTYDSWGNSTKVNASGVTILTAAYDSYGRQTTSVDKDAGTTTYEYNAYGLLTKQRDANGNSYTLTYDDLDRVKTRQGPEGTTTYDYYVNGTYNNDNLQKVTGFNGVVKEYAYDAYRRLQTEKVTVDGVAHTTSYAYNTYDNLTQTTYPSGIVVQNVFDANGFLSTVKGGASASPVNLFTGSKLNSFGQYTNYTLGNGKAGQNTYNYGMPARFYTAGVQDLNFTFQSENFNLQSRKDALKNLTETFTYDGLNRLTGSAVNGTTQITVGYDGSLSQSNPTKGNIISKTDAGNYVYRTDKAHAVAYITNPAGATTPPANISTTAQQIGYTPFLKTASISEGTNGLEFTYGPDYDRVKTIRKQNNAVVETKYFLGNYEKQVAGSTTREIHYVGGGNGLCAMIVRENGVNNFYFTYLDYLGSILTITDINGNKVAEQNFDAWGRPRNPANWTYVAIPAGPGWLYRGFTGHEQLQQFSLTNMNGRLYDAITGRMLSPDNYVPDPLSSQAYNRYAYSNNNPLLYADPDGNWWILIPIAIGAISNVVDNWGDITNAFKDGFWNGMGKAALFAGVGAVSGVVDYYLSKIPIVGGVASGIIKNVGNGAIKGDSWADIGEATFKGALQDAATGVVENVTGKFTGKLGKWAASKIKNKVIQTGVESMVTNFSTKLVSNSFKDLADVDGKFDWQGVLVNSAKDAGFSALKDAGLEYYKGWKERRDARQQVAAPSPNVPDMERLPTIQAQLPAVGAPTLNNPLPMLPLWGTSLPMFDFKVNLNTRVAEIYRTR